MKRSGPLARRTPLRRVGRKGLSRAAVWRRCRQEVRHRCGGRCEARVPDVCTVRMDHTHHLLPRSQGGQDDPAALLGVCAACHRWIHDHHPIAAEALGLLWRKPA